MKKHISITFLFIALTYWTVVTAEKRFSVVKDLQPLLETQRNIIDALQKIIAKKKKTLNFIKTEFDRYFFEHEKLRKDQDCCLEEKIVKFQITKRISTDLGILQQTTGEIVELQRNETLTYPTADDLKESVTILSRLQRFYRLNVTQLTDGILNTTYNKDGKMYTEAFLPMTASDCYQVGASMFRLTNGDKDKVYYYEQGLQWLLEAMRLHDKATCDDNCKQVDIVRYICKGYHFMGEHNKYIEWVKKMKDLKPSDELESNEYTNQFNQMKNINMNIKRQNKSRKKKIKIYPLKEVENCLKGLDRKMYRMLCRGEIIIAPSVSKRLKCWYEVGDHPFTILARFRAEQLYIHPNIYLFHNIISDADIDSLKHLAVPVLGPLLTVNGPRMMTSMVYESSKGTELNTSLSQTISRRISDFTGLDTATSLLLVRNYGVGGYYVGHVDGPGITDRNRVMMHFNLTDADTEKVRYLLNVFETLNKIASVIVYLSDVELGGATVFPILGLSQFPVKGAALFWHNMLPFGHMDYATCHGVCPVLRGSRWTAAQFIDNQSQMLHRPCKRKITSRRIEDIPHPVVVDKTVNY